MTTIKSYTDIEQAKKLAEILPLESADMFFDDLLVNRKHKYLVNLLETYSFKTFNDTEVHKSKRLACTPCWSLASLLKVIGNNFKYSLDYNGISFTLTVGDFEVSNKTIVDACVEMILKLNELKML